MKVQILRKEFIREDGHITPYKRLEISGYINGNRRAVELPIKGGDADIIELLLEIGEDLNEPEIVHEKDKAAEEFFKQSELGD